MKDITNLIYGFMLFIAGMKYIILNLIYGFMPFIAGMKDIIQSYLWFFVLHRWNETFSNLIYVLFFLSFMALWTSSN